MKSNPFSQWMTHPKKIGQLRATPWQRFVRLQRITAQLTRGTGQPIGVFRFKSHEECNAFTEAYRLNRQSTRPAKFAKDAKKTSSTSEPSRP